MLRISSTPATVHWGRGVTVVVSRVWNSTTATPPPPPPSAEDKPPQKEKEQSLEELSQQVKDTFNKVFFENVKDSASSTSRDPKSLPPNMTPEQHAAARKALIDAIISCDKEVFELKRQHELSMLRVEQHQKRMLKDQEDRGMYYEQNMNVATFDTVSVGLYSQRSTLYHTMSTERLRNFKLFLMVFCSILACAYLYYRYMINPDFEYVTEPIKILGSKVGAYREVEWRNLPEEEQKKLLQAQAKSYERGSGIED